MLHSVIFAPCLLHTPPLTATLVHPSAEHVFLYFLLCSLHLDLFRATSCSSFDSSRFLLETIILCLSIVDDLLRTAVEVARVEDGRVEETSADASLFLTSFTAAAVAAAAAASAFLS
jgi:hypothetical protein